MVKKRGMGKDDQEITCVAPTIQQLKGEAKDFNPFTKLTELTVKLIIDLEFAYFV